MVSESFAQLSLVILLVQTHQILGKIKWLCLLKIKCTWIISYIHFFKKLGFHLHPVKSFQYTVSGQTDVMWNYDDNQVIKQFCPPKALSHASGLIPPSLTNHWQLSALCPYRVAFERMKVVCLSNLASCTSTGTSEIDSCCCM